jgi:hypothetical protein
VTDFRIEKRLLQLTKQIDFRLHRSPDPVF